MHHAHHNLAVIRDHKNPSVGFIYFCFASFPFTHLISLHPILCVRAEGRDAVQTRVLLRGHQHNVSLRGERGYPRWPAHRWWNSHHRPHGKRLIMLFLSTSVQELLGQKIGPERCNWFILASIFLQRLVSVGNVWPLIQNNIPLKLIQLCSLHLY